MIVAIKTLIFTVLVPGTVMLYIPHLLLGAAQDSWQLAHPVLAIPAGLMILAGTAGYLRCAWDFVVRGHGTPAPFDAPEHLVVTGLYRFSRNPMFLSVLLVMLAEALLSCSGVLFVYAGCAALAFHLLVVLFEEPRLKRRFGAAYADYCLAVPRWGLLGRKS